MSSALTANSLGSGGYDRPDRPVNEPLNERPFYGESPRPRPKPVGFDSYGGVSNSFVNEIPDRPVYGGSERPGGLYQGQSGYGSSYSGSYGGGYDSSNYDGPSRPYKPYKPPRDPIDNEVFYNRPEVNRPGFRPGVGYYRPIDPMMDEFKPHFDNLRPESWGGYERPDPMRDPITSYEYGMTMGRPPFDEPSRPSYETRPEFDRPSRPERPQRPSGYYRPSYDDRDRPSRPEMEFSRPGRPQYEYGNGRPDVPPNFRPENRPMVPTYEERPFNRPERPVRPDGGYGQRPSDFRPPPDYIEDRPGPGSYDRPQRPSFEERPVYERPSRPRPTSYEEPNQYRPNWDKDTINRPYDSNNPNVNYENVVKPVTEESDYGGNRRQDNLGPPHRNNTGPIVSQSLGPNGEKITSIITELKPG